MYSASVKNDCLDAQIQLGNCYFFGVGTDTNKEKAIGIYEPAAERGNKRAQYNLSLLYKSREGDNKNEEKAFKLIKKLADEEYLDAQCHLGYYYSNGIGKFIIQIRRS